MKKIFLTKVLLPCFIVSACLTTQPVVAQKSEKDKKTTVRVRVSDQENGRDVEREYLVDPMNDKERKQFVDKVLDSLDVKSGKGSKVVSVTVDDGGGDVQTMTRKRRSAVMDHPDEREPLAFNWKDDFSKDFSFETEKFRNHMRNFERDFRPKAKSMIRDMENLGERMGDMWSKESVKAATVRDLNVYANNPDNGVLNLRFQVPQKGDLSIIVTDVKGKEVGKKEIKDFSGSFVGQVDLKKNTKGTVFVTVVQNEDGAVKRVIIP
jgi:hypothetical protein